MSKILTRHPRSELTPLLDGIQRQQTAAGIDAPHHNPSERFSRSRKRFIVFLVAVMGLMPMLVSGTIVPSIPQIAKDLDSTGATISLAVSVSILMVSTGSLVWASYSTFYGRRPMYLFGLPLLILGSVGTGTAASVAGLMFWRAIQALGAAGGVSLGAGVIGDIYQLEERGTAICVYFAAILLGPALAPSIGGLAAHYATWRTMQYALSVVASVIFVTMYLSFPETMPLNERGIDKLNATLEMPRRFVFVNPLSSLTTLRAPTISASVISTTSLIVTEYILLLPLAYTIGIRYGIENEFLVGISFFPWGIGTALGAPIAGIVSDRLIVKYRKKRNGAWMPEDRLRSSIVPAVTFVPLSILASGLIIRYVDGTPGLILNLISMFFSGLGVNLVLTPISAYCVDIMRNRSAEALAATGAVRGVLLSLATSSIIPSVHNLGVVWTDVFGASFALIGSLFLWIIIRYGDRLRDWSDVEYSTLINN